MPNKDAEARMQTYLKLKNQAKKTAIELQSKKDDVNSKKRYAMWIPLVLAVQLIIANAVFIAYGLGWLKYRSVDLNLYVTGTLLEIFALILIVVKYLFPLMKPNKS